MDSGTDERKGVDDNLVEFDFHTKRYFFWEKG